MKQINGHISNLTTNFILLVIYVALSVLLNFGIKTRLFTNNRYYSNYQWTMILASDNNKGISAIFIALSFFILAFLFFVAREFILVMYDEMKNQSTTKKIQEYQK